MPRVEILSPAGTFESFKAAVNAGADAIYVGGSMYGARAFAGNFDREELNSAIDYAHIHGKKVYLTVNTLLKNRELYDGLHDFLIPAYENGLDAVIVQDYGVFEFIKENFPGLDIHASTQMTVNGRLSASFLEKKGASRIVTSRELSLEEIRNIRRSTSLEIESFVHGALCYCYSGQCMLSSMIGARSGNRGRCAQPCRLMYELYDENMQKKGQRGPYILSPKDMCALAILPDVIEAGVYSLKIEGRMKSPEYVAGVVSIYRKYVDRYLEYGRDSYSAEDDDIKKLMDLFNRGNFTSGYYVRHNGVDMMSMDRPNHKGTAAIEVLSLEKKRMLVRALNRLNPQDIVDVSKEFTWTNGRMRNINEKFYINIPSNLKVKQKDVFYRVKNNALVKDINDRFINSSIRESISIYARFKYNEKSYIKADCRGVECEVYGNVVEAAKNSPVSGEQIKEQLKKLGNTEFICDDIKVDIDSNIFVSVQELKELRRSMADGLTGKLVVRRDGTPYVKTADNTAIKRTEPCVRVTLHDFTYLDKVIQYDFVSGIYLDDFNGNFKGLSGIIDVIHKSGKDAYIALPYVFRERAEAIFDENIAILKNLKADGFLIRNLDELRYLEDNCIEGARILDFNVYRFNEMVPKFFKEDHISAYTISRENNYAEIAAMNNNNAEMIVYGILPVMVSAQCVMKNNDRCVLESKGKNGMLYLKDRVGKYMPVVNYCRWCYNIIYSPAALNLLDKYGDIRKCNPAAIRIDLNFHNAEEADKVLKIAGCMLCNKEIDINGTECTRGHFLRGVE